MQVKWTKERKVRKIKTSIKHGFTLTLSSGCFTTLSLRNLVGMNPWTPLSNLLRTPMA